MLFCVNHELYFSFGQIVTDCCQINVGRSSLSSVEALTVCSSVELNMTFWQYEISDKERIPKPRLHKFSAKRRLSQGKCGRKLETTLDFSFRFWQKCSLAFHCSRF